MGGDLYRILRKNGFEPNLAKSRLQTRHDRQVVTGVVVNVRPNVPRKYVRQIRAMLHAWDRYGLDAAQQHLSLVHEHAGRHHAARDRYPGAEPSFLNVLRGRIAYLSMIRGPSDAMVRRFKDRFDNLQAGRDLDHGIDYVPGPYQAPDVPDLSGPRELLTVMFTDIVDSTEQAAIFGDDRWRAIRQRHDRLIQSEVASRDGLIVKWLGDGCLAVFKHPSGAVHCAKRITTRVRTIGISVRIGLHTGEVQREGTDIHGMGVNISSRIGGKAGPSQVLVSATVKDLVQGSDLTFERLGRRRLKGVGDRTLYEAV
jgi:class 3 adenylate cyclase